MSVCACVHAEEQQCVQLGLAGTWSVSAKVKVSKRLKVSEGQTKVRVRFRVM